MLSFMKALLVVVTLISGHSAFAQEQTPHQVIEGLGNRLFKSLSDNQKNHSSK
jgi:ABC-type transporter MlaC component